MTKPKIESIHVITAADSLGQDPCPGWDEFLAGHLTALHPGVEITCSTEMAARSRVEARCKRVNGKVDDRMAASQLEEETASAVLEQSEEAWGALCSQPNHAAWSE